MVRRIVSIRQLFLLSVAALLLLPAVPKAVAGEPTEQVRKTVDALIAILNDKDLKKPEKKNERRAKLRKTIRENFNFDEMAKRSLGIHWKSRTPQEQKEFVGLYTELLENTYFRRIERYEGEKVLYLDEKTDDSYALVKTQVVAPDKPAIPIDYRIIKKETGWSIYDITLEGVSLVNNYRTQFNSIIRNNSYEELVNRLRKKTIQDPV